MVILAYLFVPMSLVSVACQELRQINYKKICQSIESPVGTVLSISLQRSRSECFTLCTINPTCSSFAFRRMLNQEGGDCVLYTGSIICGAPTLCFDSWYFYAVDSSVLFVGCPTDWAEYDGSCYYFIGVTQDWFVSLDNCVQLGGSLVSIKDDNENNFVFDLPVLEGYSHVTFWIGAHDRNVEGSWEWINGDVMSFTKFNTQGGDPDGFINENGVIMWTNGYWADVPEVNKYYAICEREMLP